MNLGLMKYNEKYVIIPFSKYHSLQKAPSPSILKDIPESRLPMAESLMTLLDITGNDKSEVVIDGEAIEGSNIHDFMKFTQVTSDEKPARARHLYGILASVDIPSRLIGNKRLTEFLERIHSIEEEEEEEVVTPKKRKWARIK